LNPPAAIRGRHGRLIGFSLGAAALVTSLRILYVVRLSETPVERRPLRPPGGRLARPARAPESVRPSTSRHSYTRGTRIAGSEASHGVRTRHQIQ